MALALCIVRRRCLCRCATAPPTSPAPPQDVLQQVVEGSSPNSHLHRNASRALARLERAVKVRAGQGLRCRHVHVNAHSRERCQAGGGCEPLRPRLQGVVEALDRMVGWLVGVCMRACLQAAVAEAEAEPGTDGTCEVDRAHGHGSDGDCDEEDLPPSPRPAVPLSQTDAADCGGPVRVRPKGVWRAEAAEEPDAGGDDGRQEPHGGEGEEVAGGSKKGTRAGEMRTGGSGSGSAGRGASSSGGCRQGGGVVAAGDEADDEEQVSTVISAPISLAAYA